MTEPLPLEPLTLSVDVVADVCCPWCYLGKRRLELAMLDQPDIQIDVTWRPFLLDPSIPKGGLDRRAYLAERFPDAARIADIHARLSELGAADGIQYDFDAIQVASNSLDAHRLLHWAKDADVQDEVMERLLALYWTEGADIGDIDVLAHVAAIEGMDRAAVAARLASDADVAEVQAEIAELQRMGVRGVPTFILAGKYAVSGAQEVSVLAKAFREVALEMAALQQEAARA